MSMPVCPDLFVSLSGVASLPVTPDQNGVERY